MNNRNKKTMWLTVIATCASLASVAAMAENASQDEQQIEEGVKHAQIGAQMKNNILPEVTLRVA